MDLTGKTVVVTGASKGIGAATARAVLEAGARVIAHYGSDRAGAEAALDGAFRDRATQILADFADMAAVDVLVNNAGIMRQAGGIEDDLADWDRVWTEAVAINLHAPARLLRHAVRDWLDAGRGGAIVGIGSWVTTRGTSSPAAIAYAASKAGIVAATKTVARNYADRGILAYVISPGVVRTRMSEDNAAVTGGVAAVTVSLPMREWVPPEEIADLAVYLARGRARHLTGSTIDINGAAYIR